MVLRDASRGVSPVLGVVLIVAIVVTLAATVSVYALGFGEQTRTPAPQVVITTDYDRSTAGDGQALVLEVKSGDTVDTRNASLSISGAVSVDRSSGSETPVRIDGDQLAAQVGPTLSASETIEISAGTVEKTSGSWDSDDYLDLSDATVRIVWTPVPPESSQSQILFEWRGESA